jgi:predicted nuclease of predicted toxin-antitoxin system
MRFKLDENFGTRTTRLFAQAGHDVQTVRQERLEGANDELIFKRCCDEERCLVTLDLDFANVLRFPPQTSSGIVVVRVPRNPGLLLLEDLIRQFLNALEQTAIGKSLWIVETGRIRIHQTQS